MQTQAVDPEPEPEPPDYVPEPVETVPVELPPQREQGDGLQRELMQSSRARREPVRFTFDAQHGYMAIRGFYSRLTKSW